MEFDIVIKNNKRNLNDVFNYLMSLGDGYYTIKVKHDKNRNVAQNNRYWKSVRIIGNDLGYDESEMHNIIKQYFKITSTKELGKEEFSIFLEKLERWAIDEHNIKL
tara:strand:- start:16447 stop:16764 length:318 start_codon:yes stop_codon:yes gene_type:complete